MQQIPLNIKRTQENFEILRDLIITIKNILIALWKVQVLKIQLADFSITSPEEGDGMSFVDSRDLILSLLVLIL